MSILKLLKCKSNGIRINQINIYKKNYDQNSEQMSNWLRIQN